MSQIDRQQHWQRVYETKADDEVSWFQDVPAPSLEMIDRCNLPSDARIIDVGGGSSRLVDALLERGYANITVLDVSRSALDRAGDRLGPQRSAVQWIAADVTDWQPPHTYDMWHDRAAFHFLTAEADRRAYGNAVRAAVAPGGFVIIATFALDGPERCSGLPVQRYDPAALEAALGGGFHLLDSVAHRHVTPGGSVQQFQFSRFMRPASSEQDSPG